MTESGGNYYMDAERNAPRKADCACKNPSVSLHSALQGMAPPHSSIPDDIRIKI